MRRLGDIVMAGVLLAITLPLLAAVWLAIKWENPGPAFETRERIGPTGRRFGLLRFRTTVRDAQASSRLRPQDTRVGQFLRYTRLDALPELINVLRGDMELLDTSLLD